MATGACRRIAELWSMTDKRSDGPVAWMHEHPERYDVVHGEARSLWLQVHPKQVEHYTIPLYRHKRRKPMSTDAACELIRATLGADAMLDGNLLKMLRAVEKSHGIE